MSECLLSTASRENLTLEKTLDFMKLNPNNIQGWALYWCKARTKYILKDISYQDALNTPTEYMAVRFFPYGYDKDRDHDVLNNLTGLEPLK